MMLIRLNLRSSVSLRGRAVVQDICLHLSENADKKKMATRQRSAAFLDTQMCYAGFSTMNFQDHRCLKRLYCRAERRRRLPHCRLWTFAD